MSGQRGAKEADPAGALLAAREQQAAVADILRVISRSPKDLQAVFDVIATSARRFCSAEDAMIALVEGDRLIGKAHDGPVGWVVGSAPLDRQLPAARCIVEGRTIHVRDMQADTSEDFRTAREIAVEYGIRTVLATPMLLDGRAIGSITLRRLEVLLFTDEQIELVRTFADQAAIAIENVRMFDKTQEALAQQTALSEVLSTISRSAFDLDAVLQTIVERAAALCQADGAAIFRRVSDHAVAAATFGGVLTTPGGAIPIDDRTVVGRAMLTAERHYVPDARQYPDLPQDGPQTRLVIPFVRDGVAVGCLGVVRSVARPFSDTELRLFEVFADQAAIAIENVRLFNETKESLERQTALAQILGVIADSPADQQPVVEAIARNTTRYCGADDVAVFLLEGDVLRRVAHHGPLPFISDPILPVQREAVAGRAVLERRTIHVADAAGAEGDDFPITQARAALTGQHGTLATPMLREGKAVGVILLRKADARGFAPSQIQLVEAFADQAVIAIENVRLFNETKEALDRQNATAEVMKVMSSSPFDLEPVLQSLVDTAARLCDADHCAIFRRDGDVMQMAATSMGRESAIFSTFRDQRIKLDRTTLTSRAVLDAKTIHLADASTDPDLVMLQERPEYLERTGGVVPDQLRRRTGLAVPLIREGEVIGAFTLWRIAVRPFSPREIELIETFARQAVIAIENVRLFNETKEALERQTATSSILNVISRSPADQQPTLDAIVTSGARLCDADMAFIYVVDQGFFKLRAGYKVPPAFTEYTNSDPIPVAPHRGSLSGRVVAERRAVQIPDVLADAEYMYLEGQRLVGYRSMLNVPMFSKGEIIGLIGLWRSAPVPFTAKQIDLMSTFADQAVIAIENTRLFNETREALERQTSISDVLQTIGRSAFDLQPVLDTVVERAVKLCDAREGSISTLEDDVYRTRAYWSGTSLPRAYIDFMRQEVRAPERGSLTGRTALEGRVVHIADVLEDPEYTATDMQQAAGYRTLLGVPLLRDGRVIGVFALTRSEVRPFSDRQVELVRTFADQAAIAIENTRLFVATKEALDRQTALSEILKVISGSTFDLTPVAETVVERAARLCEADYAWIFLPERGQTRAKPMALYGDVSKEIRDELMNTYVEFAGHSDLAKTFQEPDVQAVTGWRIGGKLGVRTAVFVPVGRDRGDTGRIVLGRRVVRPFTEQQIDLVEIFADQAAIAIANARLFNEIQDKSRQLEVASRHKSEFLANMSHELRTPLNAIIGFSEVLVQGLFGDVNDKQREYLHDVIGSGQHLLSLINDILDLSKIEAGRMELEVSTFTFRSALQSGVTIVRERAARNGIALQVDVSDEVGQVEADERKVKQILYNLLSNAVKFTPDGGRVDVTVRRDKDDVRVEVRDNGIGIAQDDQARIFEEFQQVGRERSREGTGLGLTLTKRFVELHGGRIWVESAPGQGSTFAFTLPFRQAAAVRA